MKQKVIFALLTLFLIWSRLYQLDQIPATLPHDEMVYAIQAKSFILQGKTLDQSQGFFALKPAHVMYAEWPAQVMSLGFLLSSQSLLATHLVSALMGISLPFLMVSIVWSLWKRKDLAKATFVLFVFSPLFWQMSRLSYDAYYGLWFYIAASTLFVKRSPKLVFLSIPLFFVGFFQYQGFKLLLVPWLGFILSLMISLEITNWNKKEILAQLMKLKFQLFVLLFAIVLTFYYAMVILPSSGASARLSSLIFTDTEYLSKVVNTERRLSLNNPFSNLLSNKATAIGLFILQRLVGVFNPQTLLLLIEPNVSGFSVWTHGVFYWLEIILLFTGLAALLVKNKTRLTGVILLLGVLGLCLPALINSGDEWYLLRSMFTYLVMTILAAWGLVFLWSQKYLRLVLVIFYLVSVANFAYQYFYRYPIISLDWGNFDERVLARYLNLHQEKNPDMEIVVYGPEPEYNYWSYLLYENKLNEESLDEIGESMREFAPFSNEAVYKIGNVTFSSYCAPNEKQLLELYDPANSDRKQLLIIRGNHKTCPVDEFNRQDIPKTEISVPVLSISAVLDSGERMEVYGDQLCFDFARTFIHVQTLDQLKIENQGSQEFCSQWIKNLGLVK